MNWHRLLACLTGLAALVLSFYVYQEYIHLLGFPDGHVTALGEAERKLALVFVGASFAMGLYLIYLGVAAGSGQVRRSLPVALGLYLLVLAGTAAADRHYRSYLDGGSGG